MKLDIQMTIKRIADTWSISTFPEQAWTKQLS